MAEAKTKTAAQKAAPKSAAAPKKSTATKPTTAPKAVASKSAEPKPAATKKSAAASKPAAPKKAAVAKSATKAAVPKKLKPGPEELYRMIQTAAYFIAERNGFAGDSKVYWAEAEAQINRLLD